jgi:hypothetical protein
MIGPGLTPEPGSAVQKVGLTLVSCEMEVSAIVSEAEFEAVQRSLSARGPKMMPPMAMVGPPLVTGICFWLAAAGR